MICIVRCQRKMTVQLPDGIVKNKGETVACPSACPYKNSSGCSKTTEFKVVFSQQFEDEKRAELYKPARYSPKESEELWNITTTVGSATEPPVDSEKSNDRVSEKNESEHITSSPSETAKKYGSFGSSKRTQQDDAVQKADEALKATKSYDRFDIGGVLYSDDETVRHDFQALSLKCAVREIFSHWNTKSVFRNGELRDDFVWLIVTVSGFPIQKTEVQKILNNSDYSLSQKFFYLFYDVIYKRSQPNGFYWYDKLSLEPLIAKFTDKRDFTEKYCDTGTQGESFRSFYQSRKKEILHYLNIENEIKFFEEMPFDFADSCGEIVWIDRNKGYLPVRLGKIDVFIKSMREPTELSTMQNMISFLEKYRITTRDGLVLRGPEHVFERSVKGNLQEDSSMYNVISLASSANYASEYDCYVTLLREYVKVFSPEKVGIGTLTFTKANYPNEIKKIALDFCKALFGQVSDKLMDEKRGCAWLTKSIYERKILCTFKCENESYIDEIMDLISDPTLEKYFTLFSTPIFQIGENDYDIHNYIDDRYMDEDVYTICGSFREDKIIREYFDFKIQNPEELCMDEAYNNYQKQYEEFIKLSSY